MFLRSIRFKIILWYVLILTITLLVFSSVLYGSFTKMLYGTLDDLLSFRAEGVINSINAYWAAKEVAIAQGELKPDTFIKLAGEWVEEKRKDPELMSIYVQILDDTGRVMVSSKNMPRIAPLERQVLEDMADGEDDFDTVKGEELRGKKTRFRVYSKPVLEHGKVEFIVQVAGPVALLTIAAKNLIFALFLILPLTVALAAAPGLILVRMTLKPVDDMIDTLRQTTAENLKLKIHMPDTKDEIKRLADTFNDMIERLDRSFSSQQSFIRDISVELKAPLIAMDQRFGEALEKDLSPTDSASIIRGGREEIKKCEHVIEDLETLAKFDNNRMALEIRKVRLTGLLEDLLVESRPSAEKKDITLSSVLKEPIVIDGDERQLRQLFSNIIDNAIRFTNRRGSVSVSARKVKRSAVVNISDTGIGIEDDEQAYIFDRFYQVNKSRLPDSGFGLGLSIAKSVAELHKGAIKVESRFGEGSTFTVTLPLSYPG